MRAPCDLEEWKKMVEKIKGRKSSVDIAVVGKYVKLHDAYLSVAEALRHGGYENGCRVNIKWTEAEEVTDGNARSMLGEADGILVPGGFGERGIEGKIAAARFARGKQCAVSRYMPWHADGSHRVRERRFGAERS